MHCPLAMKSWLTMLDTFHKMRRGANCAKGTCDCKGLQFQMEEALANGCESFTLMYEILLTPNR